MAVSDAPVPTRTQPVARPTGKRTRAARLRWLAALFLAPAAAFFLILIAYPLARVIWTAFEYVNLTNPTVSGYAGLDNFTTVFEDERFWPALWRTGIWTFVSVAGEYALGLASAVALAQPIKGRTLFRGLIIIPWVIPIVVAGLTWTWMLTPDYGVINLWLVKLGVLAKPYYWLGNLNSALLTVAFVNIWRSFPFYTLSLLAALWRSPREFSNPPPWTEPAPPSLRLHRHALSESGLADTDLHSHHLDRHQFRFHLGDDSRRPAELLGNAADPDLPLFVRGLRRRRGERAGDNDHGIHARGVLRLLVRRS